MADYPFPFDHEKAKEALLYVASRAPIPDRFHICKILYFADKYHLDKYARFIYGDVYAAMRNGPVPSRAYDLIKAADAGDLADIAVDDWDVTALRDPQLDVFSKSDIEALDWAIQKYGSLPFKKLRAISHDASWKQATDNGKLIQEPSTLRRVPITFEGIMLTIDKRDALIDYLREYY
jgi:uncharacterized phage-associated protein